MGGKCMRHILKSIVCAHLSLQKQSEEEEIEVKPESVFKTGEQL